MFSSTVIAVGILLFSKTLFSARAAFQGSDYGTEFQGNGTYYGLTSAGNCGMGSQDSLPSMYHSMLPVAINKDQYDNSSSCGSCIEVTGSGQGSGANPITGTFIAYVHDSCGECKRGALDLSKSGDGRWEISWKFIPCPQNQAEFKFEGSNDYYKKIQIRGLKYPAATMDIDGKKGARSNDNFFISNKGPFPQSGTIRVQDVMGNVYESITQMNIADGTLPVPDSFFSQSHNQNEDTGDNNQSGDKGEQKPQQQPEQTPEQTPQTQPREQQTPQTREEKENERGTGGSNKKMCAHEWHLCVDTSNQSDKPKKQGCCNNTYECKTFAYGTTYHCLPKDFHY